MVTLAYPFEIYMESKKPQKKKRAVGFEPTTLVGTTLLWPKYICIAKLQKLLYTASLAKLLAQFFATGHRNLCAPNLLHKLIFTIYLCLNRPTHASVLLGYTDSVTSKVLILLPL